MKKKKNLKEFASNIAISFFFAALFVVLFYFFLEKTVSVYVSLINTTAVKGSDEEKIATYNMAEKKLIVYPRHGSKYATIEIPSIKLEKGLCSIGQTCNRVSRNIEVLKESDMPNITNGNLFLAGHNGNSSVSYFNKLDRMNIGDSIYIYYDGYKYEYKLDNYYEINKTGEANIKRDKNRTTLVLVTCKKNSKDKQMIYVAYLENKNAY